MSILVERSTLEAVIASGLLDELDADLASRYPGATINRIDPAEFESSGGVFVAIARREDDLLGCGAFRPLDSTTVELKRMFVRQAARGQGVGRAIIQRLESEARTRGFAFAVLETANRQPEAIALYERTGYQQIEPFGPYIGNRWSVCFRKRL